MTYLIVGLGRRGMFHLRAVARWKSYLPVYVYDCQNLHNRSYLFSSKVLPLQCLSDSHKIPNLILAIIATPPSTHLALLRQVLPLGCKVLIEKPSVTNMTDLTILGQLPRSERERIFVGYSERFNPVVSPIRVAIKEELCGVSSRSVVFARARPITQATPGASPCLELLVHDLDFVLNDIFPSSQTDLLEASHGNDRCSISGSIGNVQVNLFGWWTENQSTSRVEIRQPVGRTLSFDVSSGGDEGRMLALERQLDRIESSSVSADLEREIRVLEVIL